MSEQSSKATYYKVAVEAYATHASVDHGTRPRHVACRRCYCRQRKGETKRLGDYYRGYSHDA